MVDLPKTVRDELIATAIAIRERAYAPFSKFHVGAALLDDRGQVFAGVNVENSSYGLTICAERTAAVSAITDGAKSIQAVAIATPGAASPCGACRQFLYEFGPDASILLIDSDTGELAKTLSLNELLPRGFRLEQ